LIIVLFFLLRIVCRFFSKTIQKVRIRTRAHVHDLAEEESQKIVTFRALGDATKDML
jgi:hypothetical protein